MMQRALMSTMAIVPKQAIRNRLEEYYYNNVIHDVMILTYDHKSRIESHSEWNKSLGDTPFEDLYTKTLDELPSEMLPDMLFTTERGQKPLKTKKPKKLKNPIDYTAIPKEIFYAPPPDPPVPPMLPVPSRLPALKSIALKIWSDDAVSNKYTLLTKKYSHQCCNGPV
jgi:hypothetical protein